MAYIKLGLAETAVPGVNGFEIGWRDAGGEHLHGQRPHHADGDDRLDDDWRAAPYRL